jgi:hypothetical protein
MGNNHQSWGSISPLDKQCGRVMYAFFMSYVYLEKHRGDLALQVSSAIYLLPIKVFEGLHCSSFFSFLLFLQAMEKLYRIFPTSLYLLTHVSTSEIQIHFF